MSRRVRLVAAYAVLLVGILPRAAAAEPPSVKTPPAGQRPKFSSKIHLPVQLAAEATSLPPAGYVLVFADDFTGERLDTTKWGYRLGNKMLSVQQPENVTVKDGNLVIALRKEPVRDKQYTSGGVISRESFVYGYYEARFKTPPAEGWHTAFWAMWHAFPETQPKRPALLELDFCEQDGGDPHFFSFGVINQRPDPKKGESWNAGRWVIENAPDTSADFHVWGCEFTPETTRFYFDGRLTKEISSSGFPHDHMNVWFSVIASTLKGDRFVDDTKLPTAVYCDYIRVYQHPKYRDAEAAVRATVLKRSQQPKSKDAKPAGSLKDLN
jgi:beta-glucanase (GH16 family)